MPNLPIDCVLPSLLDSIVAHSQCILKAPPGAGKSTRFPFALLQDKRITGRIILLEPRRLAARNIAHFLASQLGEKVGQTVGLRMRGETRVSHKTRLEIVTEGVMTRLLQDDPELTGVSVLIFDEFHERSLHADTALAFALDVQAAFREDLRIVVMSATLEQQALQVLLPKAAYVESEGRCYPIEYRYDLPNDTKQWLPHALKCIVSLLQEESGSMLVFLPGVKEIRWLAQKLERCVATSVRICPLYGLLSQEAQQAAIEPAASGLRKVVLATNIAETSLTIEGVRLVVDCGWERVSQWEASTGLSRLQMVRIAQSSAEQRAGRAGRLEPGICVRLYSQEGFHRQPQNPVPDVLRSDLTSLALELAQWGCVEPESAYWLDLPPQAHLNAAWALLQRLNIVDERAQLTSIGKRMVQLSTSPRYSAMLMFAKNSGQRNWISTAAVLIALLEDSPQEMRTRVDILAGLRLFEAGRLSRQSYYQQQAKQWLKALNEEQGHLSSLDFDAVPMILAAGFPDRIAMARSQIGEYQLSNGQGVTLDANEALSSHEVLIAVDVLKISDGLYRVFSAVMSDWDSLRSAHPHLFIHQEHCEWDEKKGRLFAEKQECCGKLVVSRQAVTRIDPDKAVEGLLAYVRRHGLSVLPWKENSQSLWVRAQCAAHWLPDQDWLPMSESDLISHLEDWLTPFMTGVTSLKGLEKLDLFGILQSYLGWERCQRLQSLFPTHYTVPTGSQCKIRYVVGQAPVLAVRLQEMFGEPTSPCVADGRVSLVLELLSPAQRPLQITQDLAGFWQGSYREVQKEMKGRYPKHVWPDDPANHIPTRKMKRHFQ